MGATESKYIHSTNDFELAIRSSKELEHLLETEFRASGKGLHEKISSASAVFPADLERNMRYLATIRNKLVHEHGFDAIPDRQRFIANFETSAKQLKEIVEERRRRQNRHVKEDSVCIIS